MIAEWSPPHEYDRVGVASLVPDQSNRSPVFLLLELGSLVTRSVFGMIGGGAC